MTDQTHQQFHVEWRDAGREPQAKPDPAYPQGIDPEGRMVAGRADIVDRLIAAANPKPQKRPTIEELEKILASEGESKVELLPDGQITVSSQWSELLLEAAAEIKRLRIVKP